MTNTLENLMKAERKAWRIKMSGSVEDASTVFGQEGKNELAWRAAADAEYAYREANGMVGR